MKPRRSPLEACARGAAWLILSATIQLGAITLIWDLWLSLLPDHDASRTGYFTGLQAPRRETQPEPDLQDFDEPEYELPEPTVRLFDRYMSEDRPLLLKGAEEGWLFPGNVDGHKHMVTLREQLCRAVE